jgi:hypothetical protein
MDARFERSGNPRRHGELSRIGENFSTVVETWKSEFLRLLEQLLSVVWRQ